MPLGDDQKFAICASDLQTVIDLLFAQKPNMDQDQHEIADLIANELSKLPSADIGQFSVTWMIRITSEGPDEGGGSEWVSMETDSESTTFSAGNHVYTPGYGGDSSSSTLFECWNCGGSEGDLRDWLTALVAQDRDLTKISMAHERGEPI
jgi:hypothetical protein